MPIKSPFKAISGRWRWFAAGALTIPTLILFGGIIFSGRVLFWGTPLM